MNVQNHIERGIDIEVDLRALLGGVTHATIVAFRVCSLYLTFKNNRIPMCFCIFWSCIFSVPKHT